jgi:hypothetical protein
MLRLNCTVEVALPSDLRGTVLWTAIRKAGIEASRWRQPWIPRHSTNKPQLLVWRIVLP